MLSYTGIITYLNFPLDCGKSFLENHSLNQIDDNKNEILSLSIQYNTIQCMTITTNNNDIQPFWRVFEKISAPYRISKLHYCQVSQYDSSYQVQERRERGETDVRIHKGSLQECLHGLVTYGIPSHFIPLNALDGSINLEEHLKWIELRRRIESFPPNQQASIVLVPGQNDVLLGKRKMSMNGK